MDGILRVAVFAFAFRLGFGDLVNRNASRDQDYGFGFWDRLTPECECGHLNTKHKIVGGHLTEENEYPWLVSLHYATTKVKRFFDTQFCGGSLISDRWVLTAAHCLDDFKIHPSAVDLIFGGYDLADKTDSKVVIRRALRIVVHPRYNKVTMDNDLSLVLLDVPVLFTGHLRPVCVPFSNFNVRVQRSKVAIAIGWGATSEGGDPSSKPMEVSVPIIPNDVCQKFYKSLGVQITPRMLCAGVNGKDACQGDSGGPLVYEGQHGHYMIVGVVSFGIGCARKDLPGVYAHVGSYLPWIRWTTGNQICVKS